MSIERKVDDLGRVVIPVELRRTLGIKVGDKINIDRVGNMIVIKLIDGDECPRCGRQFRVGS